MSTTPKTGITELSSTASNQAPVVNSGWAIVDQLLDRTVKDKDLAAPPASPTDGDAYLVAAGATGLWTGKANQIAYWRTSANAWQFIVPRTGWTLRVADELDANSIPKEYGYTGSAWAIPLGSSSFAGGTLSSALNEAPLVTLASASTVSIGAAAANTINISGTTTIIAFDVIAAGAVRKLVFQGALTLTHHATAQILPTGASITTAAGDVAEFVSLGSGNWRCVNYLRANGQALASSGGGAGGVAPALQYTCETGSTADSDPGAGLIKWNNATQASATQLFIDDLTADAVSMTNLWGQLAANGFLLIQKATDANTWQLWKFTAITAASGYVKLGVTLIADGGAFADGDALLLEFDNGASGGGGLTNLTEAKNTASPNVTIPVVSLSVTITETNGDFAIVPKGTGAVLAAVPTGTSAGGNKRGIHAVDWQTNRTAAAQVASGAWSTLVGGQQCTASGAHSVAGGYFADASGAESIALGGQAPAATSQYATAVGGNGPNAAQQYATAIGGNGLTVTGAGGTCVGGQNNLADGTNSSVFGGERAVTRGITGVEARASGRFSANGDAQRERFILRRATTDATATVISTDGGATSSTNQIVLPNNSAYAFRGMLVARSNATGDAAAWEIKGLIKRGANAAATAVVGTPSISSIAADAGAAAWTVTATADTTNGALSFTVTGAAGTSIKWVNDAETAEVVG